MFTAKVKLGAMLVLAVAILAAPGLRADEKPAEAQQARAGLDLLGDSLPPEALSRFGTLRLVQGGRAYHMALSLDGKLLAAGDEHGKLRIWDTSSGKELHFFDCQEYISTVAFVPGPAGLRVAAGTKSRWLRVWDVQSGKSVLEVKHPGQTPPGADTQGMGALALAASPDGNWLAVGVDDRIHLWNIADGKERRSWTAHRGWVTSLTFTPDGKSLLSGGRAYESVFGGLRMVQRLERPNDDYALALWDPATGKLQKKLAAQQTIARVLGFTADGCSWGSVSSGKNGSEFRLWDTEMRTRGVVSLKDLEYSIGGAALSPDGKTLAISYSRTTGLWDVTSGKRLTSLKDDGDSSAFALAFLPDGQTLAAGPGAIRGRFWNLATGKHRHTFDAHERPINALAIAPDGKTAVTGGPDGQVREWDVVTGKPLRVFRHKEHPNAYLTALRYAPDGKTLACAYHGGISRWDTARGERFHTIPAPPGLSRINSMHLSPDGNKLVFQGIDDSVLRLWDLRAGKEVRQLPQGSGGTYYLAYSPWEEQITSTVTNRLSLWDAVTGNEIYRKKLSGHQLAYSPDGLLLGLYSEPTRILEAGSGEELVEIPHRVAHGGYWSLAFSPDGRYLAITECENVGIWDVLAGKFVHAFRGHRAWTTSVAFTPDGKRLISGAEDTTALVWDMSLVSEEKLPAPEWESLWDALKGADRRAAYTAFWHLHQSPDRAGRLLEKHLWPIPAFDAERLERFLKVLDDTEFAVREKATVELRLIADTEKVAMRLNEYAKESLSLEVRRRLERVQPEVGGSFETRRLLWGLRLLQMIDTREARAVLRRMADGEPGSPITRQARTALARPSKSAER